MTTTKDAEEAWSLIERAQLRSHEIKVLAALVRYGTDIRIVAAGLGCPRGTIDVKIARIRACLQHVTSLSWSKEDLVELARYADLVCDEH